MITKLAQIRDLYYPPAPEFREFDVNVEEGGIDNVVGRLQGGGFLNSTVNSIVSLAESLWDIWKIIAFFLSLFLIAGIIFATIGINRIRRKEQDEIDKKVSEALSQAQEKKNPRWEHVKSLASTDDPNNWRLAILEADILLFDMLDAMGYKEETLGEKLSGVEASDFLHLNDAWEAHKVRNKIAHEGSNYVLTSRELTRVLNLYEGAFREFDFV